MPKSLHNKYSDLEILYRWKEEMVSTWPHTGRAMKDEDSSEVLDFGDEWWKEPLGPRSVGGMFPIYFGGLTR